MPQKRPSLLTYEVRESGARGGVVRFLLGEVLRLELSSLRSFFSSSSSLSKISIHDCSQRFLFLLYWPTENLRRCMQIAVLGFTFMILLYVLKYIYLYIDQRDIFFLNVN